jgi:predicted amidohydrolase YtcJ
VIRNLEPDDEGWIVALGADQELYEERRGPTRDLLDEISSNTLVVVLHPSGHGGFVNSEALRRAGVDEATPDPESDFHENDENDQLTGFPSGQPAIWTAMSYHNPTADAAREATNRRATKGVTAASEISIMVVVVTHEPLDLASPLLSLSCTAMRRLLTPHPRSLSPESNLM